MILNRGMFPHIVQRYRSKIRITCSRNYGDDHLVGNHLSGISPMMCMGKQMLREAE